VIPSQTATSQVVVDGTDQGGVELRPREALKIRACGSERFRAVSDAAASRFSFSTSHRLFAAACLTLKRIGQFLLSESFSLQRVLSI
jgi:hypothetical protein